MVGGGGKDSSKRLKQRDVEERKITQWEYRKRNIEKEKEGNKEGMAGR